MNDKIKKENEMKLRTKICIYLLILIAGSLVAWVLGAVSYNCIPWTYTGNEVFETVGEYNKFKTTIAELNNNQIKELKLLSSEPPIVVFFKLLVPANTVFPYGTHDKETDWVTALFFPSFLISICVIYLFVRINV